MLVTAGWRRASGTRSPRGPGGAGGIDFVDMNALVPPTLAVRNPFQTHAYSHRTPRPDADRRVCGHRRLRAAQFVRRRSGRALEEGRREIGHRQIGRWQIGRCQSDAAKAEADEPKKEVVQLVRLAGSFADLPGQAFDPTALLMGGGPAKQKSFYQLLEQLEDLANDDTSKNVFFDLSRSVGLNPVQLDELSHAMEALRASGKKTHAYLEIGGTQQYQIAAMCDTIVMPEIGLLEIAAPSLSVTFLRDAMDLLGVKMEVMRCGDFKGAVEPYLLSRMSDHLRSHYVDMLTSINRDMVERIAKRRGLDVERFRDVQRQRLVRADEALRLGLVDKLVPWEGPHYALKRLMAGTEFETEDALRSKKKKRSANFLTLMNQLMSPKKDKGLDLEGDTIAVLHLAGGIVDGHKASPGSIVSGPTVETIQELIDNDHVKGVAVRINSPGGSATASEAVRNALVRLAEKKPVVFSMGRVAASGGYWITCIGKPILAQAGTITGSIGVFSMRPDLGALMRRIGVHEEVVAIDDEAANLVAVGQSLSDENRAKMQGFADSIYDRFLKLASKSRGMRVDDVRAIAGGRVWSGEQAVARGLVDKLGGLEDAIQMVAKEANLTEFDRVSTPKASNPFESIFGELMSARAQSGAQGLLPANVSRLALKRMGNLDAALSILYDALQNDAPTRVWALLPVDIR